MSVLRVYPQKELLGYGCKESVVRLLIVFCVPYLVDSAYFVSVGAAPIILWGLQRSNCNKA
jgi:hypothetical protein